MNVALKAVSNPPNPFVHGHLEWDDEPPPVTLEVFTDASRSILSRNESPDIPFTWPVNPYRGCDVGGGDTMTDGRFGHRMRGQGTYWESIERLLETTCRRLGMRIGTVEVLVPEGLRRVARPVAPLGSSGGGGTQLDFFRSIETRKPP